MTKRELLGILDQWYDDDDEIDEYEISRCYQDIAEERERRIEELEELQHDSGMYVQQDLIDMYRRER